MSVPLRWPAGSVRSKLAVAACIALGSLLLAMLARFASPTSIALERFDQVSYDALYRICLPGTERDSPIIIIAVDDSSLEKVDRELRYGWPWPRQLWGHIAQLAERAGARAVVFDLLFSETSSYESELGDDEAFAKLIDSMRIPVIFGAKVETDRRMRFAPPVTQPKLAATTLSDGATMRQYSPIMHARPSLALATVRAIAPATKIDDAPFLLRYYGPHERADGTRTYQYLSASEVLGASTATTQRAESFDSSIFRDKIVVIGAIASGLFDLKSSPLSDRFPGVEFHSTAIENLMRSERINAARSGVVALIGLAGALLCALSMTWPQRAVTKVVFAVIPFALMVFTIGTLFQRYTFVTPGAPLLAMTLTLFATGAWIFVTEEKQRRFILRALSQYVSPDVVGELARDPAKLALGGQRRIMSVMFSDIRDFTPISESLEVEQLGALLNCYLEEMSSVVLEMNGTVDKYLGDAILSFWNAPLEQPDHARLVCRAALKMSARGRAIEPQLAALGAAGGLFTRFGINTGPMVVGNMGSKQKFDYTVIGDAVNFASRLEGSNKFYGTQILLSESTAKLVSSDFLIRRVDLLRVKGRRNPSGVFELICEGSGDERQRQLKTGYEDAWQHYVKREWDRAEAKLLEIERQLGQDGPSRSLMERIATMRVNPPPPDWDGSYVAAEK